VRQNPGKELKFPELLFHANQTGSGDKEDDVEESPEEKGGGRGQLLLSSQARVQRTFFSALSESLQYCL
jgi:hypothetical protein